MEKRELQKINEIKEMTELFERLPESRQQRAVGIIQGLLLAEGVQPKIGKEQPQPN